MNKYKPDRELAKAILQELDVALARADFHAAESIVAKALRAHPGLPFVYRRLGDLYSLVNDDVNAKRCANGILPPETLNRKFPEFVDSYLGESVADERNYVHSAETVQLPDALTLDHDRPTRFSEDAIKSDDVFVDRCDNGSIWFDGFNRLVFNHEGKTVFGHSRGSVELISGLCREHVPLHVNGRVFLIGNRGYNNFYHWMLDIIPSLDLFKRAGFTFRNTDRFILFSASSGFQKQTLAHAGIAPEQIIELSKDTPYISADEIISPHFQNGMGMTMGRWVPGFLRNFWGTDMTGNGIVNLADANVNEMRSQKKIWLARANDARNGRFITNNDSLMKYFSQCGFEIIYPEKLSVLKQAQLFSSADVVAGVHGAGLANIVHCRPGTTVLELYGAHLAPCYWAISALGSLRYSNLFCNSNENNVAVPSDELDRSNLRKMGFTVNIDQVSSTLEMLLNKKHPAAA